MTGRSKRFTGGLGFTYINQLAVMLAGLWITPFLLHSFGQHDYGLWLLASQILTYLTLLDFGVIALLPREVGYVTGRYDAASRPAELSRLLGETARLILRQTPVVCAIAVALWFCIPAEWEALRRPFAWTLAAFLLLFPMRVFHATLVGLQDLVFTGKAQVASSLIFAGSLAAAAAEGAGLYSLPVAWTLSQSTLAVACYMRMRHSFPGLLPGRLPTLKRGFVRESLRRGLWVTVSQLAQVLLSGTDLFLIGRILGPAAMVPYAFTGKLIVVLSNLPISIMEVARPALSEMRTGESADRQMQAYNALSQATMLASGALACVILTVNRGFIGWWVGAERFGGMRITMLLLAAMVLRHWNLPLVNALFCFGGERRIALTTLADGVATAAGTVVLLRALGLWGAALASPVAAAMVSLPANLAGLAQKSGHAPFRIVAPLVPWLWRFVLMAGACSWAARLWTPTGFFALVGCALAVTAVYALLMLPVALRDPLGVYLRPRVESWVVEPGVRAWLGF